MPFLPPVALAGASRAVVGGSAESSDVTWNHGRNFHSFPMEHFHKRPSWCWGVLPHPWFSEGFCHQRVLPFGNAFPASAEMTVSFVLSSTVTCDVDFLGPERPGVLGVNPTLWHVSLFMEQWIRVTTILLRILRGDSWQVLVSDFPFCDVLIWHWREGNPDLMEWVGKRFPLFCFLRRVWEGLVLISL